MPAESIWARLTKFRKEMKSSMKNHPKLGIKVFLIQSYSLHIH